MFASVLPHAIECEVVDRHAFQSRVLAMALEDVQNKLKSTEAEIEATAVEHNEANERANSTVRKRVADSTNAEDYALVVAKAKGDALITVRKEAKAAEAKHAQFEKTNKETVKHHSKKQESHARVAFIRDSAFNMLCSGGWEEGEVRDEAIKTVLEFVQSLDAEPALVAALPGTFSLKPDQRQKFDRLVEEETTKIINTHFAKLDEELVESHRVAKVAEAELLGLWAIMAEANDSVKTAEQEKELADKDLQKASADRASAEANAVDIENRVCSLSTKIETLKLGLEKITDARDAIERLRIGQYSVEATEVRQEEKISQMTSTEMDVDVVGMSGTPAAAAA